MTGEQKRQLEQAAPQMARTLYLLHELVRLAEWDGDLWDEVALHLRDPEPELVAAGILTRQQTKWDGGDVPEEPIHFTHFARRINSQLRRIFESPDPPPPPNPLGEHGNHPRSDWRYEVANGDTTLGYWEWVEQQIESHADDDGREE